jgi:hypothetical protein
VHDSYHGSCPLAAVAVVAGSSLLAQVSNAANRFRTQFAGPMDTSGPLLGGRGPTPDEVSGRWRATRPRTEGVTEYFVSPGELFSCSPRP